MKPGRRARVVESHTIARAAFRLGGLFAVVAAVWSAVVLVGGGSWWGPLHAFLAGTVLLAISGASQMFTITWAAAPAPPRAAAATQRWLAALGTGAALVGVSAGIQPLVWIGAGELAAALLVLGWSIRRSVLRSLLRRFDLSSRFYLAAFASGAVGVGLGALLGSGAAGAWHGDIRLVHSHLNLVGLVGFSIIGTLPTFLPTIAHHRAVSGKEANAAWSMCLLAAGAMASGLWIGPRAVGAGTLLAGGAAAVVLAGIASRLWERARDRPAFVQVGMGVLWLVSWAAVDGVRLLTDAAPAPFPAWTGAVALAGVGQVLAGSLAYLLPVLAGPPLGDNADRMTRRPWIPLVTANLGGLALVAGYAPAAVASLAVWVLDFGRRVASLRRRPLVPSDRGRSAPSD